ncbi:MAG: type II toxin-antitoxin system PemK/MazF family toxin [Balneolales bacterium]
MIAKKSSPAPERRPSRGEIWWAQLDPPKNHQTMVTRPCLVISVDQINAGSADILIVVPIEFENLGIVSHIPIDRKDVDIKRSGYIQCENIRLIPLDRVQTFAGLASPAKMDEVEETLSLLLGLG